MPGSTQTTCRNPRPRRWISAATSRRRWKDIWGSGQGIGAVDAVVPAATVVERLAREYAAARAQLG